MTRISRKTRIGAAAAAIAIAAALTPTPVAQADPVAPMPLSSLGAAATAAVEDCVAGAPDCDSTAGVINGSASTTAIFGPPPNIFQNQFYWFGPANLTPPPRSTVFTFTPLSLIPGFLKPLYSWFTQHLNFEVCILGASVKIGPYGSITGSVGRGC